MTVPSLLLLLLCQSQVPHLGDRINDQAGVIRPSDQEALRTLLSDLERTDSTQVVLLTVPTTGGKPIEEYAIDVARSNGIGQKQGNNGVLIVIAVQDRLCRIEVGTGLEGRLTDALSWHIIKTEMIPRFKSGDYSGGALAGAEAVVKAVRGEYRAPSLTHADRFENSLILLYGFIVFVVALVLGIKLRSWKRPIVLALLPQWPFLGVRLVGETISFGPWFMMFIVAFIATSSALSMSVSSLAGGWSSPGTGGGGGGSGGSSGGGGFSGGGGSFSGGGSSGSW